MWKKFEKCLKKCFNKIYSYLNLYQYYNKYSVIISFIIIIFSMGYYFKLHEEAVRMLQLQRTFSLGITGKHSSLFDLRDTMTQNSIHNRLKHHMYGILNCSDVSPLEACKFSLPRVPFPLNDYQMKSVCSEFEKYYSCFEDKRNNFEPVEKLCGVAQVLFMGTSTIKELCTEGSSLHEDYKKHAPCLSLLPTIFLSILDKGKTIASHYIISSKNATYAEHLGVCIMGAHFLKLLRNLVSRVCPKDLIFFTDLEQGLKLHQLYCSSDVQHGSAIDAISLILEQTLKGYLGPQEENYMRFFDITQSEDAIRFYKQQARIQ